MLTHSRTFGCLLWLLLGMFGIHRFYYNRKLSGCIYMLTLGLAGLGYVADAVLLPRLHDAVRRRYQAGRYNYTVAWSLLLLFGALGAHRFYTGRWKSGLLYAATLGLAGLGVLHDLLVLNDMLSADNEAWIESPLDHPMGAPSFG